VGVEVMLLAQPGHGVLHISVLDGSISVAS